MTHHPVRRLHRSIHLGAAAALALLGHAPAPAQEGGEAALIVRAVSDTTGSSWQRGETLVIPRIEAGPLAAAEAALRAPPDALPINRFLLHGEAPSGSRLLFFRQDPGIVEVADGSRAWLAHDGESLVVFALWAGLGGTEPGSSFGTWPRRTGPHAGPLPPELRPAIPGDPDAPFDNAEFMVLSLDTETGSGLASHLFFIDPSGAVVERDYRTYNVSGYEERSDAMQAGADTGDPRMPLRVRTQVGEDGWRAVVRVPLARFAADGTADQPPAFAFNLGRVTGSPARASPLRASSLAGSFLGRSIFPRFTFGASAVPALMASFSFGSTTAWMEFPRGQHTASATILALPGADRAVLRHAVEQDGTETVYFDETVPLRPGLNRIEWSWVLPPDAENLTHRLTLDGRRVARAVGSAAPLLFFSPLPYALPADGRLRMHADLGYLPEALAGRALAIRFEAADGSAAHAWRIDDPAVAAVGADIDVRALAPEPGAWRLTATLLGPDGREEASAVHALQVTPARGAWNEPFSFPLVPASAQAPSGPVPLRVGLPFPAGLVADTDAVNLVDDSGMPVPFSIREAARWIPDHSIRWAFLDFRYDPARRYTVRRAAAPPAPPTPTLSVSEGEETFTVSTGALVFTVGRSGFDGFRALSRASEPGTAPRSVPVTGGGFTVLDEAGVRFDSRREAGTTTIEEINAHRVTLAFTGRCVSEDGIEVLRYILRVTAHAGQPALEFMPTFIVTADTRMFRFREITFETGLATYDRADLPPGEAIPRDRAGRAAIRQASPDRRQVWTAEGAWRESGSDEPAQFHFGPTSTGIGLAVRDFRNKAPLSVEHRPGAGLSLGLWPDLADVPPPSPPDSVSDADLPRLPFAHQGPLLDFNIPPLYLNLERITSNTRSTYFPSGIEFGNAMGTARTHEFLVSFAAGDRPACEALEADYLRDPRLAAAHAWMARTEAVGALPMSPRGPLDPDTWAGRIEIALDRVFDWEMRALAPVSPGKWTWGAAHTQYRDGWTPWRLFRNTHHGGTKGYWYQFARTGDPKYLDFAARATEYLADIALCHYADTNLAAVSYFGKEPGAVCDYKGYVPWHSGSRFDYNTYSDYFLNWYYLTGHPRARDAIEAMHAFLLPRRRSSAGSDRAGASRMESACSLYTHTRDSRLIRYLHASIEVPRSRQTEVGYIPTRKGFGTWLQYYLDLTENPAAIEVLRRWAYLDVTHPWFAELSATGWMPHWWDIQGYAYRRFRDPALLGVAMARLEREIADPILLEPGSPHDGFLTAGNVLWSFGPQKAPSLLWAVEEAGDSARPAPPRDTFGLAGPLAGPEDQRVTAFRSGPDWTTWAVFAPERTAGSSVVTLRFAGHRTRGGEAVFRILAADGSTLHEAPLPGEPWASRNVSGIAQVPIDLGNAPGPFRLQVRSGQPQVFGPLLPFAAAAREVYPTGPDRRFGLGPGHRRIAFHVPEDGADISVSALSKGSHVIRIRDAETGRIVTERIGYLWQPGLGGQVTIPAEELAPLRGRTAVLDAVQEGSRQVFVHGAAIPPYVSLGAEAFFLPPSFDP